MNPIVLGILPVAGVVVGAILQHFLAKSKEAIARAESRRHEAYAEYLQGVAGVAINKNSESLVLVADAKSRIAIYGSAEVIAQLAKFAREGSNLEGDASREAFLFVVEAMRRESQSNVRPLRGEDIKAVLLGLPR